MPRRVKLPGADELFRTTTTSPSAGSQAPPDSDTSPTADQADKQPATPPRPMRPSGRVRHADKITVYVSPEELVDLEHCRLILRARDGLAVDRGRIVREALSVVLADFDAKGDDSILVRRLRG